MKYTDHPLHVNTASNRFELAIEGSVAFIDFKLSNQTLLLIHTEVPDALQGKGAGTAIVEKALQYAKDNNYKVVPRCVFVQSYLKRHPAWNEIVASDADRSANKL